jgi:membrane-bound ClpP family serine protease
MAAILIALITYALRSRTAPIRTGYESLVGRTGIVHEALVPAGSVQVSAESWTAESLDGNNIPQNAKIKVVEVRGLKLIVEEIKDQK